MRLHAPVQQVRLERCEALIEALQATPTLRIELDAENRGSVVTAAAPELTPDPEGLRDADGATVVVLGAGYSGKRRIHDRLHELGARLVIVDEAGHWSEGLVADGVVHRWLGVSVTGDPELDATSVLAALSDAGVRPDGVLTFWEHSAPVVARVARASAARQPGGGRRRGA
jgi:ATP-grasp N-terminal domain